MYNFNEGNYSTVEEAQKKKIESLPREDSVEVLGVSVNDEMIIDYNDSNVFLEKVVRLERNWNPNALEKLLHFVEKKIDHNDKDTNDNEDDGTLKTARDQSIKNFFLAHLNKQVQSS